MGQLSADSSSTETRYCLNSVSPPVNTIASRDQFKPMRIGENLVVNYNVYIVPVRRKYPEHNF